MKRYLLVVAALVVLVTLGAIQFVAYGQEAKVMTDLEFSTFFLPFDGNTQRAVAAIDGNGGIHVAYSPASGNGTGKYMAYYAYCAAECANPTSWQAIAVGEVGYFGGQVRLELDPQGKPRMLWYRQLAVDGRGRYVYAACSQNCLSTTNWQSVEVASAGIHPDRSRYFAVDPLGRPRFFYVDTESSHRGVFYRYCDSSCLLAANWREGQFSEELSYAEFALTFDDVARPRLAYAYSYTDTGGEWRRAVGYAQCNTACNGASSWTGGLLYLLGVDAAFSMYLDSAGNPRLALFQGYFGDPPEEDYLLYYAWCNTGCTDQTNWSDQRVVLPQRYGYDIDLALDKQDRPHLAYAIDDMSNSIYGLGYAHCTANCQSSTPTWEGHIVETVDDVQKVNPVPVKPGCSISAWITAGEAPSLVLDGEGNPQIAHNAEHGQGGTCSIQTDIQLVRFAATGSGGGATEELLYLPLLRKP